MMKKRTMIAAAVLSVMLTACGSTAATEESKTESPAPTKQQEVENVTEPETEIQTEAQSEEPEDRQVNGIDLTVYYPSDLKKIDTFFYGGTHGETEQMTYFLYGQSLLYQENNPDEDFAAADVADILANDIVNKMREAYPSSEDKFSMSVETEAEAEVLGRPFLYRTGVMHAEELDQSADLNYAGYFGVVPMEGYDVEKVPVCWIAFTESDDPQALAELEAIVQNAAEKAEFIVY
ncbi:MAG: hypothetical protein IJN11_09260 [Oscillospiraceae bacterium]|nr:hypothetical protein [Oscillospiraceae bacterium]